MASAIDDMDDNMGALGSAGGNVRDSECENLLRPNKKISLNDFELIKVIGRGTFGKVYLVRRNGTENYYAMKKLTKAVVAKRNLFIKTQGKSNRPTKCILFDFTFPLSLSLLFAN